MTAFDQALKNYWDNADAHRRGKTDMEWVSEQRQGPPRFMMGDIVEFKVGGFGIIKDVSKPHDGWPASYSTDEVPGKKFHAHQMCMALRKGLQAAGCKVSTEKV